MEVVAHIISFLSFHEKARVMRVSRVWHSAAKFALQKQKGFVVDVCAGNKLFCDQIPQIGWLDTITERSVRRSIHVAEVRGKEKVKSKLSTLCPNIKILCDSCCDQYITLVLLREFKSKLVHLQLDSYVSGFEMVTPFPNLKYLKYGGKSRFKNMGQTFPALQFLDCLSLMTEQMITLPHGLMGIKIFNAAEDCMKMISESPAKETIEVFHVITNRATDSLSKFSFPKLNNCSVRGLERLENLFSSLWTCKNLTKLEVACRNCVTVENDTLLKAFERLPTLTSLSLRFIVSVDPVQFWTRMVEIFASRLQHLTFSTHFITSECIRLMAGLRALETLNLTFVYNEPFLYNNVPEEIRNREPFTAVDLLAFFREPTASKHTLRDITVQMKSLGRDMDVINSLGEELWDMKLNHSLQSGEIREIGNRNSILI